MVPLTISWMWHFPHIKVQKRHLSLSYLKLVTKIPEDIKVHPRFCLVHVNSSKITPQNLTKDTQVSVLSPVSFGRQADESVFLFFSAFPKANTEQLTYLQNSSASLYIKIETSWLHGASPACLLALLSSSADDWPPTFLKGLFGS